MAEISMNKKLSWTYRCNVILKHIKRKLLDKQRQLNDIIQGKKICLIETAVWINVQYTRNEDNNNDIKMNYCYLLKYEKELNKLAFMN